MSRLYRSGVRADGQCTPVFGAIDERIDRAIFNLGMVSDHFGAINGRPCFRMLHELPWKLGDLDFA